MKTLLLYNSKGILHDPGQEHPESPKRLESILEALNVLPLGSELRACERYATMSDLRRVHTSQYIDKVFALSGCYADLDYETKLSPESVSASLQAAGTCIELVDQLLNQRAENGFAIVRPPGHHAERNRGMGYCVFNNIAIGAAYALEHGISRILIIDWDVHHGNGTQEIFYDSSEVLMCSLHQDRLFPKTGTLNECGSGSGSGFTINIPFPPEATDLDYFTVANHILDLIGHWYRPELILISCGFDSHFADPMGNMKLSPLGFAMLTQLAMDMADCFACGRIGLVLEGGYAIGILGECVMACIRVLCGNKPYSYPPIQQTNHLSNQICAAIMNHRGRFPYG